MDMDNAASQEPPTHTDGLGSWHPARRPDSQSTFGGNSYGAQEGEDLLGGSQVDDDINDSHNIIPVVPHDAGSPPPPPLHSSRTDELALNLPILPDTSSPEVTTVDPTLEINENVVSGQALGFENATVPGPQPTGQRKVVFEDDGSVSNIEPTNQQSSGRDISNGTEATGTVSTEPIGFDWTAKNEVDPAWGSAFESIGAEKPKSLSYTNSFPEVPPLNRLDNLLSLSGLAHSQAEDIMKYTGKNIFDDQDYDLEKDIVQKTSVQSSYDWDATTNEREDDFFAGNSNQAPITPIDEEARFEEGLPLIQSQSIEGSAAAGSVFDPISSLGLEDGGNGDDFLSDLSIAHQQNDSASRPQPLYRKDTDQILSSMDYSLQSEVHASTTTSEQRLTLADLTGGGIAVSKSTVLSQVLADQQSEALHEGEKLAEESAFPEEDLAAKWQAVLDDDDLLEDEPSLDPSVFFGEDGEGLLDGPSEQSTDQAQFSPPIPQPIVGANGQVRGFNNLSTANVITPLTGPALQSRYAPQQRNLNQSPYKNAGFPNKFASPNVGAQVPSQLRPELGEKTQSFADKSKGGYTSPYDLPVDVSRPKKRAGYQQSRRSGGENSHNRPLPPPRSSSIQTNATAPELQGGYQPVTVPTPASSTVKQSTAPTITAKGGLGPKSPPSGTFFEELPIVSKARPSSSAGRFTPRSSPPVPTSAPQVAPQTAQYGQVSQDARQQSESNSQGYQLLPPERVLPYSNVANSSVASQPVSPVNARYSPVPPTQPSMPLNRNIYSTPPVGGPPRPPSVSQLPFQPRMSSPLARSASASQQYVPGRSNEPGMISDTTSTNPARPSYRSIQTEQQLTPSIPPPFQHSATVPALFGRAVLPDINLSNRTSQYHHPLEQSQIMSPDHRNFNPPPRSQTLSPGSAMPRQIATEIIEAQRRRASDTDPVTPQLMPTTQPTHRKRGSTLTTNFIKPTDGREHDPLERWKGCPIFEFGFGGNIVTSFPKQIPRYGAGQALPMLKCSPGEIRVQTGRIIPLDERIAKFPGPLKSKNKKKEVLAWLEMGIEQFKQETIIPAPGGAQLGAQKRQKEKLLLWNVLRTLVEYDGTIDGNDAALQKLRKVLSPGLYLETSDPLSYDSNGVPRGIIRSGTSKIISSPEDPAPLESLRKHLLQGEREKAVWHAVDQRLWGHAMLLASTMQKELWKQVTQEFVRQEVRTAGENTESLAAVYDVFAGNWEEIVDELVPPSAQAGFQMVSISGSAGPVKNGLEGLDQWQETLGLILSNRSSEDPKALVALGQLLARYGRIEAAHICYLFAKPPGLFGGPDDPQASIALLGADNIHHSFDYGGDMDSILLTEVYEFVYAMLAPITVSTIAPHLQAHKLHHAMVLAEFGYRDEAQQYCDAITNALKATTKLSPYYHVQLFGALDDLSSRLRQAPKDGSSSWITKPSMDKVSGSVWNRFNQFISGDDSDAASTGSNKGLDSEAGPFARIAGDTPSISREASPNDQYGSYMNGVGLAPIGSAVPAVQSRYAPAGVYTPRSSLEQTTQPSQLLDPLESTKRAELRKQPSYSSLPGTSPGYQPMPQSENDYQPGKDRYLPTPPIQTSSSPEIMGRNDFLPYGNESEGLGFQVSQPNHRLDDPYSNPSYQSPSVTQTAQSSPYEPHPSPFQSNSSHEPSNNLEESAATSHIQRSTLYPSYSASYQPSPTSDKPLPAPPKSQLNFGSSSYNPLDSFDNPTLSSYEPASTTPDPYQYEPLSNSYEPPSYEPPSFDPETQNGDTSPLQEKPKARSFMDDDEDAEDEASRKKKEKAMRDREADEAFRKAAEADAKKDARPSAVTAKSSWLGSLWGGSKAKDPAEGPSRAPIKARLGEESSFYYDKELKKWINKKAGAETSTTSSATPPPPKGPPSRAVSSSSAPPPPTSTPPPVPALPGAAPPMLAGTLSPPISSHPPSNVPSRNISPHLSSSASPAAVSAAPQAALMLSAASNGLAPTSRLPSSAGPTSAPPSRPTTGMSGASNIDDLLGAPAPRKGGTVKGKKKGRGYIDVMAK